MDCASSSCEFSFNGFGFQYLFGVYCILYCKIESLIFLSISFFLYKERKIVLFELRWLEGVRGKIGTIMDLKSG